MLYNTKTNTLAGGEVEITGTIDAATFAGFKNAAITELGSEMEIDGFRKGKAPAEIIEKNLPAMIVLEEMANQALSEAYPKILEEHKIDAIGRPAIQLTKIAHGSELGFTIRTAVMPVVTLPDYKKIAKEKNTPVEVTVTDTEVDATIMQIRTSRARVTPHEHKEGEEHSHDETVSEENLPVLDDEFVKSLGMFENVEDFKTKVRENIKLEKEHTEHEKNRLAIMEAIMADTTAEIPELLIDAELDKMLFRMKSDITNMGLQFEDYLKHMGKEESVMRTEFHDDAKKRVMMELILDTIGTKENIEPDAEKVEKDVTALMNMYKEADPARTRAYVEHMTRTEQVFAFLENQK